MKRLARFTVITMTLFLCLSGLAVAQDKKPDATLTMSEGQVALGIGTAGARVSWTTRDRNTTSR